MIGCECQPQLPGDGLRKVALQSQEIAKVSFVAAGPQGRLGRRTNQSSRHADPPSISKQRPFEDAVDTQLTGDLRHGLVLESR